MNKRDTLTPRGHLEIYKIYNNGHQDLHWSDHNIITSGMNMGLAVLFSNQFASNNNITSYQIRYFQLGVSGTQSYGVSTSELVSSVPYSLVSSDELPLSIHNELVNGVPISDQLFFNISQSNILKASPTSVRYHLIIPANCGNDILTPLNEVGLYMKNPLALTPQASVLVAYRYFSPILKTDQFSLLFRWVINF